MQLLKKMQISMFREGETFRLVFGGKQLKGQQCATIYGKKKTNTHSRGVTCGCAATPMTLGGDTGERLSRRRGAAEPGRHRPAIF